jgi:hypothetical protein
MRQLELIVHNQSSNLGNIILYQEHLAIRDPDVQTLAWLVKPAFPNTRVSFKWHEEYNFAWSETGKLGSGILSEASQTWVPADPTSTLRNSVRLTCVGGVYKFVPARAPSEEGSLLLEQDETIPMRQVTIGIGMQGQSVLALPAQPNMNLVFKPNPVYVLSFGWHNPGEVLQLRELTNPSLNLTFPANVYSRTVTLSEDNRWVQSER